MPKLKYFSNEFDVLCSKENKPWIGGLQCFMSSGTLFLRDFGQEGCSQSLRRGNMETGHNWIGDQGFPGRLVGPIS